MGLADLHIHTIYSWDGTSSVSGVLKYATSNAHLDVIAITDHDEIDGALQAVELAPSYGIEVIPGSEISTRDGHLLALFIRKTIRRGLPLEETIFRVQEQGGICIAPHPEARGANGLKVKVIQNVLKNPLLRSTLLGVETFNASLFDRRSNAHTRYLDQVLRLAQVGNSDSHVLNTIGLGATRFPGHTAQDLLAALVAHTTRMQADYYQLGMLGLMKAWLPLFMLRKAGWVGASAGPQESIRFSRLSRL